MRQLMNGMGNGADQNRDLDQSPACAEAHPVAQPRVPPTLPDNLAVLLVATSLGSSPSHGGETFIVGLANEISNYTNSLTVLATTHAANRLGRSLAPNVRLAAARRSRRPIARLLQDYITTAWEARRSDADVVIYPHEWCPQRWPSRARWVIVIQSVLWLSDVTYSPRRSKRLLMRALTRATSRRAEYIVAPSKVAAALMTRVDPKSEGRLRVAPYGVDPEPRTKRMHRHVDVLIVTGSQRYKNPDLAAEVQRSLALSLPSDVIAVVGVLPKHGRAFGPTWESLPPADMRNFMSTASLVIVCSELESFGYPAYEAIVAGTRCIVLVGTPMAEELGRLELCTVVPGSSAAVISAALRVLKGKKNGMQPDPSVDADGEFSWHRRGSAWRQVILDSAYQGAEARARNACKHSPQG